MNDQIAIPCVVMRGGTSRGPFFLASDLPAEPRLRDAILLSVMGGGHDLGIDGIGGGNAVINKVPNFGLKFGVVMEDQFSTVSSFPARLPT